MARLRQELASQRPAAASREPPLPLERMPAERVAVLRPGLFGRSWHWLRRYVRLPAELDQARGALAAQESLLADLVTAQQAQLVRLGRLEGDLRFEHRRLARLVDGQGRTPADSAVGTVAITPVGITPAAVTRLAVTPAALRDLPAEDREALDRRLSMHLERVNGAPSLQPGHPLLDIGCKTGDWLALLGEAGIEAYGVDIDPQMVEQARARGVNAQLADGLAHLSALPDGSLGWVSALRLLEYLPIEEVGLLIGEARRVLVAGGCLMIETPNAGNPLVAIRTSLDDPRRNRLLAPSILQRLLESEGFRVECDPSGHEPRSTEDATASAFDDAWSTPADLTMIARKL
jgi:SAM-dependent methyltransferase